MDRDTHTEAEALSLGTLLEMIASEQSEWSQQTFGCDKERGPLGALMHLEKEAREALAAPDDAHEYADCLLLVLDAARRAGFEPLQLLQHAYGKLQICKQRKWPKPTAKDQPVEHIREPHEARKPS